MIDACIHGHAYDEANTQWYRHSNGRLYRRCVKCCRRRLRLKYRNAMEHAHG